MSIDAKSASTSGLFLSQTRRVGIDAALDGTVLYTKWDLITFCLSRMAKKRGIMLRRYRPDGRFDQIHHHFSFSPSGNLRCRLARGAGGQGDRHAKLALARLNYRFKI
jgi:hypothetical protein